MSFLISTEQVIIPTYAIWNLLLKDTNANHHLKHRHLQPKWPFLNGCQPDPCSQPFPRASEGMGSYNCNSKCTMSTRLLPEHHLQLLHPQDHRRHGKPCNEEMDHKATRWKSHYPAPSSPPKSHSHSSGCWLKYNCLQIVLGFFPPDIKRHECWEEEFVFQIFSIPEKNTDITFCKSCQECLLCSQLRCWW